MSTYLDTVISDVLRETLLYLPLSDISTIHKVIGHNRSYFRDDHFWKDYWYAHADIKKRIKTVPFQQYSFLSDWKPISVRGSQKLLKPQVYLSWNSLLTRNLDFLEILYCTHNSPTLNLDNIRSYLCLFSIISFGYYSFVSHFHFEDAAVIQNIAAALAFCGHNDDLASFLNQYPEYDLRAAILLGAIRGRRFDLIEEYLSVLSTVECEVLEIYYREAMPKPHEHDLFPLLLSINANVPKDYGVQCRNRTLKYAVEHGREYLESFLELGITDITEGVRVVLKTKNIELLRCFKPYRRNTDIQNLRVIIYSHLPYNGIVDFVKAICEVFAEDPFYNFGVYDILSIRYDWSFFSWYCDQEYPMGSTERLFIETCEMVDLIFLKKLLAQFHVAEPQILQVCLWTSNCEVSNDSAYKKIPRFNVILMEALWEYLSNEGKGKLVVILSGETCMGNNRVKNRFEWCVEKIIKEHKLISSCS